MISNELLDAVTQKALQTPRGRTNHNFHVSLDENPNRFLNVMVRGTYFTPHRHAYPPKPETFLALRGSVVCVLFDDSGNITATHRLGEGGAPGIDIAPGIWHTIIVLSDTAACFEVKPGPYSPADDKEFAPWAPREGSEGCAAYAEALWQRVSAKPAL